MRHAVHFAAMLVVIGGLSACGGKTVEATNEKPSAVASKVAEAGASGTIRFNPGRWETQIKVIKMDMEGMPPQAKQAMEKMLGKGRTVTSCMTKEEAEKPDGKLFGQADENCTYDHFTLGDGKMDAKLTCKTPNGQQVMTMNGTYTGDTYNSSMQMQGPGMGGKAMTMTMELAARRVGDCDGSESK